MLQDKDKKKDSFKSIREYLSYLMVGKTLDTFGYNYLLPHGHQKNAAAVREYREYKKNLLSHAYTRLLQEYNNDRNIVDTAVRKYYFLQTEPLVYPVQSEKPFSALLQDVRKFHRDMQHVAIGQYKLQPIVINGEESCYLCKRTKRVFVSETHTGKEYLMLCPHAHQEMLDDVQIPKLFIRKTFDTFTVEDENRAAFESFKTYAEHFDIVLNTGESLLLMGPVGTGKSHLAVALLLELIFKPLFLKYKLLTMKYISLPAFLTELRATGDESKLQHLVEAAFLVVDDLGIETLDDWGREKVFTLVNKRYQEKLPTVFVSDLSPTELVSKADERIISRLHEMCRGIVINGNDKRRVIAE